MELLYPICNDVVGIDQPQVIRYCNEKFKDTKAQFVADNFEDPSYHPTNPFDLIICSDVIEHIEDPDILLNYIKSFAGKETYIIISTPERDILR